MNKTDKLKLCQGCRENYYNQPGNTPGGECWLLANAKPVQRTLIGVWQNPPYQWAPQQTLGCHRPEGSVWIDSDDCRIEKEAAT